MLAEVDRGLTGLRARATSWEPMSAAAWPAATIAAAAVAGAMVGKGEVKFALLPVAALVALLFARLPVAGFVAVLWSVGTAIDMIALPEVGAASLRFEAAEVLLWLALASLVFLPTAARRELISLALRRESLVMALFSGRDRRRRVRGSRERRKRAYRRARDAAHAVLRRVLAGTGGADECS